MDLQPSPTSLDERSVRLPADSRSSPWRGNLLLTLPFLVLYWSDLYHHDGFFDEINAWAISATSPNLSVLFHRVHFEGHPWLWYFILWFPSRLTHNPAAMKWIIGPVSTAILLVIGMLTPFTRIQKAIILSGYFVVFEYTVMNRMYGIIFLLALLFTWRKLRKPDSVVLNVLMLGVMANVDMTGVLLSGALLLEYAYDRWDAHRKLGWGRSLIRQSTVAVLIYVTMVGISGLSVIPSKQISYQAGTPIGSMALIPKHVVRVVTNMVAAPWWPINPAFPRRFQETDTSKQNLLMLLAPFVLYAYWRIFRRDRNLLILMCLTLSFGILFADIVYVGRVRHWGISFISFLICLWIQRVRRVEAGDPHADSWSRWTYALLGASVVAGILATASSWYRPYSQARAAAEWIKTNEPGNVALVGQPDVSFATVAERLDRPVYFLECNCVDTFKQFSKDREMYTEDLTADHLLVAYRKMGNLVFLFYRPFTEDDLVYLQKDGLKATPLVQFPGADSEMESYYIYRITGI